MKAFVAVSSLLGLTAADPFAPYLALGGAGLHPTGASYSNRSPQGLGKRDADALGLGAGGFIHQSRPGLPVFGLHHNGVGAFAHPVGKREASEEPEQALATHPNGGTSFVGETVWGFPAAKTVEKRDADPLIYAPYRALGGAGLHPTGASYSNRSPQGLGKRDADPLIYAPFRALGGAGLHPTGASYSNRSPQGLGKRDADPLIYAPYRALGGAGLHPTGASFSNRSPQGLFKREADALGLGAGGFIHQSRPGLPIFGLHHNGVGAFAHPVGKREAAEEPEQALATHPNGGTSFVGETVWGFPVAKAVEKRDADPLIYAPYRALGGAGLHPTGASYSNRSPQGLGKREADPLIYASYRALGGAGLHPTGASFSNRSPQGLFKRDADALGLGAGGFIHQSRPGLPVFGLHHNGVGAFAHPVGKREASEEPEQALAAHPNGGTSFVGETVWGFPVAKAVEKREAEPAVGYSNRSPQGAYGLPAPYLWG